MRVILDTNVVIASLATRGLCHSVFELCLDRHEVILSPFLVEEIKKTLLKKIKIPEELIGEIVKYLAEHTTSMMVRDIPQKVCRDPSDARILALAKISHADYIITGDDDLLVLKKYGSTDIITPRQFWEISKE